jgi:hypothetical protein
MESHSTKRSAARYSRRGFLKSAGLGAAGAFAAATLGPRIGSVEVAADTSTSNDFTRIFPNLPPFFTALIPSGATSTLNAALSDIGKPGGLLDAHDNLTAGQPFLLNSNGTSTASDGFMVPFPVPPVNGSALLLVVDPNFNGNNGSNPDNPTHTAGTHFMGQFMDHDMTFDQTSILGTPTNPFTSPNTRSPYFDLDSMYGQGPTATPQFYDPTSNYTKLNIGTGGVFEDLLRDSFGNAIIPDPRNDENLMVAGLHCAFIKFHNNAVDYVQQTQGLTDPGAIFAAAKQLTLWHYHWLILNEFLPLFIGPAMVNSILPNGRRFYLPQLGQAAMPVEFQAACYRFGHTMVRPSYRANLKGQTDSSGNPGLPFFGLIFDPTIVNPTSDPADLRGGFSAPRRFIGWQTFFNFHDGNVKPNKRIDNIVSTPLFTLPLPAIPSHQAPQALPQRNLLRQVTWSLPSGQAIAVSMNAAGVSTPVLTPSQLRELANYTAPDGSNVKGLDKSTPLWYYALKEAALTYSTDAVAVTTGLPYAGYGLHLGPLGGRIVGEVIIGLLQSDPNSWVYQQPNWTPTLPNPVTQTVPGSTFRMTDFLSFAGVDPTTRHNENPSYA